MFHLKTNRIFLKTLNLNNAAFIYELVNTTEWITNIGNKNIHNVHQSKAYIEKIIQNANVNYWVAYLNSSNMPIGIITIIKRDYLEVKDIGFAFLPQFFGKGYAFESAGKVLQYEIEKKDFDTIFWVTIPTNIKSIKLLSKLGLSFSNKLNINNETLFVYAGNKEQIIKTLNTTFN